MQAKNFRPIKAIKPTNGLKEFIGKTLNITLEMAKGQHLPVVVETIVGSKIKPTRFEVNGKYFIVILDAYKQLNKDRSITQENIDDFDESVLEHIEPVQKAGSIDAPKPLPVFDKESPIDHPKEPNPEA